MHLKGLDLTERNELCIVHYLFFWLTVIIQLFRHWFPYVIGMGRPCGCWYTERPLHSNPHWVIHNNRPIVIDSHSASLTILQQSTTATNQQSTNNPPTYNGWFSCFGVGKAICVSVALGLSPQVGRCGLADIPLLWERCVLVTNTTGWLRYGCSKWEPWAPGGNLNCLPPLPTLLYFREPMRTAPSYEVIYTYGCVGRWAY